MTDDPEYDTDFRKNPEEYKIGRGCEGVFKIQPYKDELLPLWSYADEDAAEESADALLEAFYDYLDEDDFVGADMARKYLRMGYTRAMRYAKYPGGKKYKDGEEREPEEWADSEKRRAAVVFEEAWKEARQNEEYRRMREEHRNEKD